MVASYRAYLPYDTHNSLPRAFRIQPRACIVDRQKLLAQEHMVLLDQLVRDGARQLDGIRGPCAARARK